METITISYTKINGLKYKVYSCDGTALLYQLIEETPYNEVVNKIVKE